MLDTDDLNRHPAANPFIDYEAMVDPHDDIESDGSNTDDDFVVPDDAECVTDPPQGSRRWADYENGGDDANDEWEGFLQRAFKRSELEKALSNVPSNVPGGLSDAWRLLANNSLLDRFHLEPFIESAPNRYWPLYYVKCRHGVEKEAVFTIMQNAKEEHDIRAAYTRGSYEGRIYLETTMSAKTLDLLRITPGILQMNGRIYSNIIPVEDRSTTLRLPQKGNEKIQAGQWVRVLRGTYRNDIGWVWGVRWDGRIIILLVPRLGLYDHYQDNRRKRRRLEGRPPPALLHIRAALEMSRVDPAEFKSLAQSGEYGFDHRHFTHGLLVKTVKPTAITTTGVLLPTNLYTLFCESGHPEIFEDPDAPFPLVLEWEFVEGDRVYVLDGPCYDQMGTVQSVEGSYIIVNMDVDGAIHRIVTRLLYKTFEIGDFVKVLRGESKDRMGWIQRIDKSHIDVIEKEGNNASIKFITVHRNNATIWQPPIRLMANIPHDDLSVSYKNQPGQKYSLGDSVVILKEGHPWLHQVGYVIDIDLQNSQVVVQREKNFHLNISREAFYYYEVAAADRDIYPPCIIANVLHKFQWLGKEVIIRKPLHAWRTCVGTVIDVVNNHPEAINGVVNLVVRYGGKHCASNPHAPSARCTFDCRDVEFVDKINWPKPAWKAVNPQPPHEELQSSPSGSQTPMPHPGEFLSSSPAWNPLSEIPDQPKHILLNPQLHNVKVKAVVNGGEWQRKNMIVYGALRDGQAKILGKFGKRLSILNPEWISLTLPDVTRHEGLLIIIKGENFGRFARRIHHGMAGSEKTALVAIVNRIEGQRDSMEKEVHLTADYLAIVDETKEEKDFHSSVLDARRKIARAR